MRTVTDQAIAVLEDGGLTVGDGTGKGLAVPYVVVYPLGETRDGTLGAPWSEIRSGLQPTCVGVTREQAQWLEDRVIALLTAHDGDWWVEVEPSGPMARDDDTGGVSLFYAYPRFTLHT